jgi:hypothetical protein
VLAALPTGFSGRRGPLFRLALKTGALTVLTLGIYRFWMKTRLRRWYWSAIRPGGLPLEYVGEPLEKLTGFLIAVVFLAFYIGIFNLILMFLSFSLLNDNFAAYALSFVGVIPMWFYAQYRARRYLLARTRWRGLRFGVAPGAWGYAGAALWNWFLTLLTLGWLLPRQTFRLEKYRTDRTFFGDARLTQGGEWRMLRRPAWPLLAGLWLSAGAILAYVVTETGAWAALLGLTVPLAGLGWVHYRVAALRLLTGAKRLEGGAGLVARPRTGRVLGIYLLGNLLVGLCLWGVGVALVVLAALGLGFLLDDDWRLFGQAAGGISTGIGVALGVVAYFAFFLLWGVFRQVFVTLPLLRHYAETLEITHPHRLDGVAQRARDEFAEAEGFAEALDVGASI